MTYCSIKVDLAKASEIKDFYQAEEIIDEKHPYDYFFVNKEGVAIHGYRNKKEIYTIIFSGEGERPFEMASLFSDHVTRKDMEVKEKQEKVNIKEGWEDFHAQIGSDEVGKGDFFGPLIVVAAFVEQRDIPYLEKMRINDSKKMKDDYILSIGAQLKRRMKSYIVMVTPEKLSTLYENHFNMDKTLSLCHNHAHIGLMKKYNIPDFVITYVDQFTPEKDYRKQVGDDIIANPLYFRVQGETYYPSVAVASVIARYTFLKEWEKMENELGCKIPKGASALVDKVYNRLRNLHGEEVMKRYVKTFFANYKKQD